MKKITIVSSCFNEQDNLPLLYEKLLQVTDNYKDKYEWDFLFLDNSSTDNTAQIMRDLAAKDKRVKIILNARNFGHLSSPFYGLTQADGDAAIFMASDLQDPPELIPQFIEQWEKGFKIVFAQKINSKESKLFHLLRTIYYKILGFINDSGAPLVQHCTGFGLYDKDVLAQFRKVEDRYPYLRGIACDLGYPKALIPFEQPLRKRGITKNNFYTLYDCAMIGITNHSKIPLRLAVLCGFGLSLLSFLLAVLYLVLKLMWWNKFPMGTAPILISIFFFASVQLFFIGILGEYIGTILTQVLKRPMVVEKERINF